MVDKNEIEVYNVESGKDLHPRIVISLPLDAAEEVIDIFKDPYVTNQSLANAVSEVAKATKNYRSHTVRIKKSV